MMPKNVDKEVENFMNQRSHKCFSDVRKRKKYCYKHQRADQLLLLYNECLQEGLISLLRKFQNDRVHTLYSEE